MKKVLIIYTTAGVGHKKAAQAVKEVLDEIAPQDVEVSIIDSLNYTSRFLKLAYINGYLILVNRFPSFWGFLYYLTDNFYVNLLVSKIVRFNNWSNSKGLVNYLLDSKPDVIISTHFLPSEIVADLKKKGRLKSHLVTIVTDYRLHSWWVSNFVDTYVVASQDAEYDLMNWKVTPSKVKVVGIPVGPNFAKKLDRERIRDTFDLKKGIFTILVIGGGFGVGPIEDIVKIINDISKEIQVIVICGHNKELVNRLNILKPELKIQVKIFGFVDNVYDFMEAADILISKSGGITVTESLAKELPMIIISPILGQETRNCDFLTRDGAALKIDNLLDLKYLLEDLVSNPEKIEKMKDAIRAVRRPMACYDIAQLAIEICRNNY